MFKELWFKSEDGWWNWLDINSNRVSVLRGEFMTNSWLFYRRDKNDKGLMIPRYVMMRFVKSCKIMEWSVECG